MSVKDDVFIIKNFLDKMTVRVYESKPYQAEAIFYLFPNFTLSCFTIAEDSPVRADALSKHEKPFDRASGRTVEDSNMTK